MAEEKEKKVDAVKLLEEIRTVCEKYGARMWDYTFKRSAGELKIMVLTY
ncbi:hypothetical protein [Treponema sp. Marseille-Q4130]|nr:hypothetical protein [Treponema sp. Marseille-Q4130]MBC6720299.1 hypothetical protein [Treponema sp. Marseille-Q4130]